MIKVMIPLTLLGMLGAGGCIDTGQGDDGHLNVELADQVGTLSATGCNSVAGPMTGSGTTVQRTGAPIPGAFTRSFVPTFFRSGPWTGGLFVQDVNGLTQPAIVSTGSTSAWMTFPTESGETINGFSITVCGDGKSLLNVDTFATMTDDNPTDRLVASGSGGPTNNTNTWMEYNVPMAPTIMTPHSSIYASLTAASALEPTPSEAVALVRVYYDR
ncbi:MAG: hypothetical protein V4479_07600 [Actinomycetota bacterium]